MLWVGLYNSMYLLLELPSAISEKNNPHSPPSNTQLPSSIVAKGLKFAAPAVLHPKSSTSVTSRGWTLKAPKE